MLKIGVVCEGQTDFIAIKAFIEAEFKGSAKEVDISIIQPSLDNSLPAGWTQVLYWLENNDFQYRTAIYSKKAALFAIEDNEQKFDALLFQIDADVLGEEGFETFIAKREISYSKSKSNIERGNAIRHVLVSVSGHSSDASALSQNEIIAPIVESSETWVIAAENVVSGAEMLTGQALKNAFGGLVARATGQTPLANYENISKKMKTRKKICALQSAKATPRGRAHHYDEVIAKIASL